MSGPGPIYTYSAVSTVTPIPSGDPYNAALPSNAAGDFMLLYVDTEGSFLGNVAPGWSSAGVGGTRSDSGFRGVSPHRRTSSGGEAVASVTTGWPDFSWTSLAVAVNSSGLWTAGSTGVVVGAGYNNQPSVQDLYLYSNFFNPGLWFITLLTKDLATPTLTQSPTVTPQTDYTITLLESVLPPSLPALPAAQNPPGNFSTWAVEVGDAFDKSSLWGVRIATAGSTVRAMFVAGLGWADGIEPDPPAPTGRWRIGRIGWPT